MHLTGTPLLMIWGISPGKLIMTQVPNLETMFGSESTRMQTGRARGQESEVSCQKNQQQGLLDMDYTDYTDDNIFNPIRGLEIALKIQLIL
jgi:hypothetical protein